MYRLEQHHGDVLREPTNGYDIRYFDEIRKTEWVKCIEWLLQEPYVLLELDGDPVPFNQLHANVLLLSIYRLSHTCTIHFCPGKTKLHILIFFNHCRHSVRRSPARFSCFDVVWTSFIPISCHIGRPLSMFAHFSRCCSSFQLSGESFVMLAFMFSLVKKGCITPKVSSLDRNIMGQFHGLIRMMLNFIPSTECQQQQQQWNDVHGKGRNMTYYNLSDFFRPQAWVTITQLDIAHRLLVETRLHLIWCMQSSHFHNHYIVQFNWFNQI